MTGLPPEWTSASVDELARGGLFCDGDWVESKDQDSSGGIRLTQLADVGIGTFRDRSDRWMRVDQAERLRCTYLRPGDVLVARMPEPLGRSCIVPESIGEAVTAVDVAVVRVARPDVDPRFLMWALNSPEVHRAMVSVQSGTTRKRISRRNLGRVQIPLPPVEEQRRIVDIVEDHLSRLAAAAAYLGAARRRSNSAVASLIARATSRGEPLPLSSLAISAGYGTSTKCVVDGPGVPVVRIPNLNAGQIDLHDEKRVADAQIDVTSLLLAPGDLLIVRTNGSRDLIGRCAVVQDGIEAAFASYLIRYRLDVSRVLPEWVRLVMDSPASRAQLEALAASSAGQYNLSLGKLDRLPIRLPTIEEQRTVVRNVSEGVASLRRLDAEIADADRRGTPLRRALLQAAFSGRLTGATTDTEIIEELASV